MDAASDAAARRAFPTGVTADCLEGVGGDGRRGNSGAVRAPTAARRFPTPSRPGENQAWRQRSALDSASNERQEMTMADDVAERHPATARPDPCALRGSSSPPASCAPLLSSALLLSFSLRRTSCRRRRTPSTRSRASSSVPRMCAPRLPSRGPCHPTDAVFRSCSSEAASGDPTGRTRPESVVVLSEDAGESIEDRRRLVERADGRRLRAAREILACTPSTASRAGRPS